MEEENKNEMNNTSVEVNAEEHVEETKEEVIIDNPNEIRVLDQEQVAMYITSNDMMKAHLLLNNCYDKERYEDSMLERRPRVEYDNDNIGCFDFNHLEQFIKLMKKTKMVHLLRLKLKSHKPLTIECLDKEGKVVLEYLLAPRIDNE